MILTPCRVTGDIISIRLRIHAPVNLLTYLLTQKNQCSLRLAYDLVSRLFSSSTAFVRPRIINMQYQQYFTYCGIARFVLLVHATC